MYVCMCVYMHVMNISAVFYLVHVYVHVCVHVCVHACHEPDQGFFLKGAGRRRLPPSILSIIFMQKKIFYTAVHLDFLFQISQYTLYNVIPPLPDQ